MDGGLHGIRKSSVLRIRVIALMVPCEKAVRLTFGNDEREQVWRYSLGKRTDLITGKGHSHPNRAGDPYYGGVVVGFRRSTAVKTEKGHYSIDIQQHSSPGLV